ncbi:hypothetical protein HS048_04815 [Planomonospora sp. ID91781]|uniref:Uncharacterized protein n=1 Tax=Planomonospora sphaerica TaxID=161355 RepID=A0A171D7C9_9ACTN|nr:MULTISPECIES: hypothetical protein [Planomonospora]MBG0820059.1 hypothetical protein [Planomonospora sp. ID91781]GAT67752.1 hypothetical protein PS9374_03410 [Planomonospora sphaerica]
MRSVHPTGGGFAVTDDPDGVIDVFLGCAISLGGVSGRPLSVEFAERFSPEGSGMRFPVFVAYRAEEPDDVPEEFDDQVRAEVGVKELWVLTNLWPGRLPRSAVIEGPELRHLLGEVLELRSSRTRPQQG